MGQDPEWHSLCHCWLTSIWEWPRSCAFIQRVAHRLAEQKGSPRPLGPVGYVWPGLLPRNLLFLLVVLVHGFRRLLPPGWPKV